ncbi:ribonuclease H-like domain-containing protein [Fennellomyces sp. T-0311]|nr:ribonuclease H-like domain-containing protein [Fennellomyces sp. T-0311]
MHNYIKDWIQPILDEGVGAIVLEQQRYRQNSAPAVFEHTIRVNSIEAMLWYALYESVHDRSIAMEPVSRKAVDRMWQSEFEQVHTPPESPTSAQRNRYKKAACVKLVDHWLDDEHKVHVSRPELKDAFRMEKKQDDMADCLLQAMTWYRWRQASLEYIQEYYDHVNG